MDPSLTMGPYQWAVWTLHMAEHGYVIKLNRDAPDQVFMTYYLGLLTKMHKDALRLGVRLRPFRHSSGEFTFSMVNMHNLLGWDDA